MIKISPSILAADFSNLQRDISKVKNATMLHIDVMDGHFVPNISVGVPVVKSIRNFTDMFLDVHLMITNPLDYIEAFCNAGADSVCFHLEAESDVTKTIEKIKSFNKRAALAIKPDTPAEAVFPFVKNLDMVLVMTVEPGFGGQSFMEKTLPKITAVREYANKVNPALDIQVDGGINFDTAKKVISAGSNVLVAGSFVFKSENPSETVDKLLKL